MSVEEFINKCAARRFEWGTFDCCIYAAEAIALATGRNPMDGCPHYNDEVSASVVLAEHFGSTSVIEIFMKLVEEYGAIEVPIHLKEDGHIACVKWPTAFTKAGTLDQSYGMAVCYNGQILACSSYGLVPVPSTHRVISVWSF